MAKEKTDALASEATTTPAPKPPMTVEQALESPTGEARALVAKDALDRQLEHAEKSPPPKPWKVTCRVDGELRAQVFEAQDENEAWARFCDTQKLPESKRSRKFMRPTIEEMQPAAA